MIANDRIPTPLFGGSSGASILALALLFAAIAPSIASAQEGEPITACPELRSGCHEEAVEFHWREGFLDAVMFDTGWVPAGSPLQVRFALFAGGETEADLAGRSLVWWPSPLSVAVPGTPETGRFGFDYGLEILARIRFDVTVAGTHYTWEGDIPVGSIPHDLRMAASTSFDSMLLEPMTPRPIRIEDATERFRALDANLAGLTGIPGLSGGFAVDAEGSLAADYRTDRIEIGDAPLPIELEGGFTVAGADEGTTGFGAAKDVVIQPIGHVDYEGVVTLYPTFYFEILGRRFDLALTSVAVPIVDLGREARFDPVTVHVALPDARIEPRAIDFGDVEVGGRATRLLEIRNEGEAELTVTPRMARAPFEIAGGSIVVAAHSARSVELAFAPLEPGPAAAMLFLETDDPDESLVVVRLSGNATESSFGDAGVGDGGLGGPTTAGGCGCRVDTHGPSRG
ncbi:MAG: hypothetical protein M3Y87_24915, partial [Myxococcota bacterium]|nr:hypothetical protein [Myxococcota bacterium]